MAKWRIQNTMSVHSWAWSIAKFGVVCNKIKNVQTVSLSTRGNFPDRCAFIMRLTPALTPDRRPPFPRRVQLSKVQEVQMDSNPYKSPPPELLAEGISTVMQYVRVRMERINRMYNMILERCEQVADPSPNTRCSKSAINTVVALFARG